MVAHRGNCLSFLLNGLFPSIRFYCERFTVSLCYQIGSGMNMLQTSCPEEYAWTTVRYHSSGFLAMPDSPSVNAGSCFERSAMSACTPWGVLV